VVDAIDDFIAGTDNPARHVPSPPVADRDHL